MTAKASVAGPAYCKPVGKAILALHSEEIADRLIAGGLVQYTEMSRHRARLAQAISRAPGWCGGA